VAAVGAALALQLIPLALTALMRLPHLLWCLCVCLSCVCFVGGMYGGWGGGAAAATMVMVNEFQSSQYDTPCSKTRALECEAYPEATVGSAYLSLYAWNQQPYIWLVGPLVILGLDADVPPRHHGLPGGRLPPTSPPLLASLRHAARSWPSFFWAGTRGSRPAPLPLDPPLVPRQPSQGDAASTGDLGRGSSQGCWRGPGWESTPGGRRRSPCGRG